MESDVERVTLSRGFLTVSVREPNDKTRIAKMLESWYPSQAPRVFNQRLEVCFPRVEALGIAYPQMMIRDMKARWGSCSSKGNITLNLKLVQASKTLIDYVILYELCHLKEHNHSSKFYSLLDRILPDWRKRREQLNRLEIVWR